VFVCLFVCLFCSRSDVDVGIFTAVHIRLVFLKQEIDARLMQVTSDVFPASANPQIGSCNAFTSSLVRGMQLIRNIKMLFAGYHVTKCKEGKVKLSLCLTEHHAMKAYWGSGCIASLIL
jgi:hypothetical protein